MAGFDYSTEAELFPLVRLRRKFTKGGLVGYKRFTSAAEAIRFAVEQLPPDLLRGAYLEAAEERFDASGIRQLYESDISASPARMTAMPIGGRALITTTLRR